MAGVLQHLRSSTLDKRPNPASMVDGQIAINYASGAPGMFFKDSNGSLVKVGPVHVGSGAPNAVPASSGTAGNSIGEQWLDTSGGTYVFKIWDGAAWRSEAGEFVNATGDTMTGDLVMNNANVVFEGSVDDGFETTLTVVNPTADRTITLPDVTGTVVTTGDSGTVTSTMIANSTIVNADISASAAIAGTKISPDFGSQTIQTTGIISAAAGSAAAPSVAFTGDTNTGIYSPGADQAAISTNGTGRLFVDASGNVGVRTATPAALLDVNGTSGTYPTQQIRHSAINIDGEFLRIARTDTSNVRYHSIHARNSSSTTLIGENYIQFKIHDPNISTTGQNTVLHLDGLNRVGINDNAPGSTLTVKAATGVTPLQISGPSSEFARIDSSGRLLVGTSSARTFDSASATLTPLAQIEATDASGALSITRNSANSSPPGLFFGKSRSGALGGVTAVIADDVLGNIAFEGADGTNLIEAAQIECQVDGTPGTNDMPGRLVLSTTLDGASSPTEALRITNDRVVAYNQAAPAAVNATATLTVANLKTGIITSTSAAATDMTLPTGTDTEAGFSGIYTNMTFEWSVINTGPSLVRVLAGTAHTIVGSGSVATGTSGRFASRRTAANTFVTYRLS